MPPKSRQSRIFFESSKPNHSAIVNKAKPATVNEISPRVVESLPPLSNPKSFEDDPRVPQLLSEWVDNSPKYHCEDLSPIDMLLLQFDLRYEYGSNVGISRIERYKRAEKFGLNPPTLLGEILVAQAETIRI